MYPPVTAVTGYVPAQGFTSVVNNVVIGDRILSEHLLQMPLPRSKLCEASLSFPFLFQILKNTSSSVSVGVLPYDDVLDI